jgi:hypothetical protein
VIGRMIGRLPTLSTHEYRANAGNIQPAMRMRSAPPCQPNYAALVTLQTRLTADGGLVGQLLSSARMIVEVKNLATGFFVRDSTSCNATTALVNELRRVEHSLGKLDISVTGVMDR